MSNLKITLLYYDNQIVDWSQDVKVKMHCVAYGDASKLKYQFVLYPIW